MVSVAVNIPATAAASSPGGANSDSTNSNNFNSFLGKSSSTKGAKATSNSSSIDTENRKKLKVSRSQTSFETMTSTVDINASENHANQFFSSSQSSITSGLLAQAVPPQLNFGSAPVSSSTNALSGVGNEGVGVVAEGMLCKYTNVVNGWKNRWFVLNKDVLEYYEKEDHKCNLQKPRGTLSIFGAIVVPSDDDYLTFTVTTQGGQTLKLKASDQKERSFWISRLRQAASTSVSSSAILWSSTSQLPTKLTPLDSPLLTPRRNNEMLQQSVQKTDIESGTPGNLVLVPQNEQRISTAITQAQSSYSSTCNARDRLREAIERLPNRAFSLDVQLLQMKANAAAVCVALDHCIMAVRKSSITSSKSFNSSLNGRPSGVPNPGTLLPSVPSVASLTVSPPVLSAENARESPRRPIRAFTEPASATQVVQSSANQRVQPSSNLLTIASAPTSLSPIDHDTAVEDTEKYRETGIGNVEPQRPVILQMLAELKLGMDLTRVSLPTFILEKRSLLEMFADCMSHPDLFLKIADQPDAEARMQQVLIWYLTSIHAGRQGDISKKPYNPIIGETFHCCWDILAPSSASGTLNRVTFTAEQVSHHPPVTAFYLECPAKMMTLSGSIWTKSQFLGMSIGAQMIGQITLNLLSRNESYTMTLPSAYARSILSYPWVELGDRCTINCQQTGYAASIVFHTKGAYGGTLHRVSGEVHPPNSSSPSLRFSGEWTGHLDFNSQSGESFSVDVTQLPLYFKRVRPLSFQSEWESRRLWQAVTQALKNGDIDGATNSKKNLEEQQRQAERLRKDKGVVYEAKYFDRVGTSDSVWVYKNPLRTLLGERRSSQLATGST